MSLIRLNVVVIDELREVDVGSLEGQSTVHNWKEHDRIVDSWKQGQALDV